MNIFHTTAVRTRFQRARLLGVMSMRMHEYQRLILEVETLLLPLNFTKVKEDLESDYCGSMLTIYANDKKRFMVEWDGEEGYGAIQNWINGKWVQLETLVVEGTEKRFEEKTEKLMSELTALL